MIGVRARRQRPALRSEPPGQPHSRGVRVHRPDDVIVSRFHGIAPTAPEAIDWHYRQRFFDGSDSVQIPDAVPEWDGLQETAGTILVRGTLRHRENDRDGENTGEQWHEAHTHGVDVYPGDGVGMRVRVVTRPPAISSGEQQQLWQSGTSAKILWDKDLDLFTKYHGR